MFLMLQSVNQSQCNITCCFKPQSSSCHNTKPMAHCSRQTAARTSKTLRSRSVILASTSPEISDNGCCLHRRNQWSSWPQQRCRLRTHPYVTQLIDDARPVMRSRVQTHAVKSTRATRFHPAPSFVTFTRWAARFEERCRCTGVCDCSSNLATCSSSRHQQEVFDILIVHLSATT